MYNIYVMSEYIMNPFPKPCFVLSWITKVHL